jgi:predicted Rossmann-fold nucleotide-binding protein
MDLMVEEGAITAQDLKLFTYVDEADAAWNVIRTFYSL